MMALRCRLWWDVTRREPGDCFGSTVPGILPVTPQNVLHVYRDQRQPSWARWCLLHPRNELVAADSLSQCAIWLPLAV
jgi:hypothetical protein